MLLVVMPQLMPQLRLYRSPPETFVLYEYRLSSLAPEGAHTIHYYNNDNVRTSSGLLILPRTSYQRPNSFPDSLNLRITVMIRLLALPVILLCTAVVAMSDSFPPPRCSTACRFVICGFRRAIISHPRFPITRPICFRGSKRIGQILKVGQARIAPRGSNSTVPISRFEFNGANPYPPNFIRPMRADLTLPNVSSLRVRPLPRPAIEHLRGSCVRVPVRKWVEGGKQRSGRGCVAFNIQVPTIMVELRWSSNDDLDLFVVEPDGTSVFFQEGGGSGNLLRDAGRRSCGRKRRVGSKETIVYYANNIVKPGTYTVSAEHTKNCMEARTTWEIRVVVRGQIHRRVRGLSNLPETAVIPASILSFNVSDESEDARMTG